jgi:peptidyl-prolyl cis-trans isomerase D
MLDSLRSFAGSPVGIVVFAGLIVGLLFFGLGGFGATSVVASVGGQQVSQQEFASAYTEQTRQMGLVTPTRAVAERIPWQVAGGLIQLAAIADRADQLGMGLSDIAVAEAVAANAGFLDDDGNFNPTLLENYLRQTGLTERELIDLFRDGMIRNQLLLAIRGVEAAMPLAYQRVLSDFFGEERSVRYAVLTPDLLESDAEPTEEELLAFYEDNVDRWQIGEIREVVLLELSPRALADLGAVTDEEIRAEYDARARQSEQRNVWQFVFTAVEGVTAADRAAAVEAELEAGATFDDLVAAGTIAPNDLGMVNRDGLIDPAMSDAAFAMEVGDTEIIDGRFGPTLVHVSEVTAGDLPLFEELADDIRQEIAESRTFSEISALTVEVDETRDTGAELTEVGDMLNIPIRTVAFDIRGNDRLGEAVEDLPVGTALFTRVFEADVGAAPAPVAIPGTNGGVWFEVLDITPPQQLALEEIRDRVVDAWREESDALRLQALAESVVGLLQADEPIEQIQADIGITFLLSEPLTRASAPPEGATPELVQAAFGGPEGFAAAVAGVEPGTLIVIEVADVTTPDFDPTAEQPLETDTAAAYLLEDLTFGYVNDVQNRTPISFNETLMLQIIGATQ